MKMLKQRNDLAGYVLQYDQALNSNLSRDFFFGLNLANYRLELNHSDLLRPSCVLSSIAIHTLFHPDQWRFHLDIES